jgi:hypothetical protein
VALLDNLLGTIGFDPAPVLESLGVISDYCDNETDKSDRQISVLNEGAKRDPRELLSVPAKEAEQGFFANISNASPINLSNLFDESIGQKAQTAANLLVDKTVSRAKEEISTFNDNVSKALEADFDVIQTVDDAWSIAQNTLSLVMTTNGTEFYLLTMQSLAKQIIAEIEAREQAIDDIVNYTGLLYNQLRFIINGSDQALLYLQRLRDVLAALIQQESQLRNIRNTLSRRNVFQKTSYDQVTNALDALIQQMRPPGAQVDGGFFQDLFQQIIPGPLQTDGKTNAIAQSLDDLLDFKEEEERFQTLLSLHLNVEKIGKAAADFAARTTKINSLISAYLAGQNEFRNLDNNNAFNQTLISHMDGSLDDLASLIFNMDDELSELSGINARKPFQKSRVSFLGPQWALDLTGVVAHMKTLPSVTGDALSNQLEAANLYLKSVEELEKLDGNAAGIATITVEDAKEDSVELTQECVRVVGATFRAITTFSLPPETEQRFFYIRDRAELSRSLGDQIIDILRPFSLVDSAALTAANQIASRAKSLMRNLGFDKAADNIDLGKIDQTLRDGAQAATYVGSAILAVNSLIQSIDECPATDERDVQALEEVRNELRGDEIRKELNARRVAKSSRRARQTQLEKRKQDVKDTCSRARATATKCVPSAEQPKTVAENIRDVTGGIIDFS